MKTNSNKIDIEVLKLLELSLDQASEDRANWIISKTEDDKIRAKALKYLTQHQNANAAINTGGAVLETLDDMAIPDQIGAYKITGLIGHGGMGSVYRGERVNDDFEHDVAIKVVRPGAMSDKLVARFQTERQTLAKLIHPHIARLYDGGTLENGAPYIVMEFVDGLPLTEWADSENLPLDDRLILFQDVCSAVSFAHQNLIIHRDITPSNVLVDTNGNVKLIDFGIAKPFDKDTPVTDTTFSLASLSFTPGFAAPERSEGAGANTLSDIYSLGKLLSALLQKANDKELMAIADKAAAQETGDRYQTVSALKDEIENYSNGFPITAHAQNAAYKINKFVKRHKLGVLTSTAALMGLITAVGVTSFQYQRAETARIEADARFNDVRNLAKFMLYDLYDELQQTPGSTQALEKIAKESRHYLSQLNALKINDFDLEMETIRGYLRLADITGNPFSTNLGHANEASNIYDETHRRLDILLEKHPNNPRILRELTQVLFSKASLEYTKNNDSEQTNIYINKALLYISELKNSKSLELDDELLRIRLIKLKGSATLELNRGEEAITLFKSIEDNVSKLLEKHPEKIKVQRSVAEYYHIYAYTYGWHLYNIDEDDALPLPLYKKAIDRYRDIIRDNPDLIDAKVSLALIYSRRAESYVELEDYEAAIQDNLNAAELINTARAISPNDQYLKSVYVINQGGLINSWAVQGRKDEILKAAPEIIDIRRQQVQNNLGDIGYIQLLANTLQISGEALLDTGERKQGCVYILEALEHVRAYSEKKEFSEVDKKNVLIPAIEFAKKCNDN